MKVGFLSAVKVALVSGGERPHKVPFGLYRNLILNLSLRDRSQLFLGLWERETYPYIRTAARRCRWVIDVGSGRGELCLFFLKQPGAHRVIAVEPCEIERQRMSRNLALNGYKTSDLVLVTSLIGRSQEPGFVRLDDVPAGAEGRGFIKIDVDGGEIEVLQSGKQLLSHAASADILVETHSISLERECFALLSSLGFDCQIIKNAWWRSIIPEHRPIGHNRWLWATKGSE